MDGTKKKEKDYFALAIKLSLVPELVDGVYYQLYNNPTAYYDLKNQAPILSGGPGSCYILDHKSKTYVPSSSSESKVQRACKNIVLKYNLNNL